MNDYFRLNIAPPGEVLVLGWIEPFRLHYLWPNWEAPFLLHSIRQESHSGLSGAKDVRTNFVTRYFRVYVLHSEELIFHPSRQGFQLVGAELHIYLFRHTPLYHRWVSGVSSVVIDGNGSSPYQTLTTLQAACPGTFQSIELPIPPWSSQRNITLSVSL